MSKHGGKGREWHAVVMGSSNYICQAESHDPRCQGFAEVCHHIVFRAHLTLPAMWLAQNGIALSTYCHLLAHASHNANIEQARLDYAVRAVNKVQGDRPEFRIQPFYTKGLA